jgi:hypothetical protein
MILDWTNRNSTPKGSYMNRNYVSIQIRPHSGSNNLNMESGINNIYKSVFVKFIVFGF